MNRDTSAYEILFDLPSGEYDGREIGGIRTRTVRAGESLEIECYPVTRITREARREKKTRQSSPAQQLLNQKNAVKRACRLLEANFGEGDLVCHPTYDYRAGDYLNLDRETLRREWEEAGIPMDGVQAQRKLANFLNRLRRRVKQKGGDPKKLKALWTTESTCEPDEDDENPLPAHWHHHMVISSLGVLTVDDITELWPAGFCKPQPLDLRHNGLKPLAKYLTKQKRRGTHKFGHTRNLKEPRVTVSDRRISRRRAALVATDVQANALPIFAKLYPGYRLEECEVRFSDWFPGASIYARLRKYPQPKPKPTDKEEKNHGKARETGGEVREAHPVRRVRTARHRSEVAEPGEVQ